MDLYMYNCRDRPGSADPSEMWVRVETRAVSATGSGLDKQPDDVSPWPSSIFRRVRTLKDWSSIQQTFFSKLNLGH